MFIANERTHQISHCDPLIIADEVGEILYADRADVEFTPPNEEGNLGRAVVTNADDGPPIEIDILSRMERMDRVPDLRLGMRSGFTLFGSDSSGQGVTWHIDGAADLFAVCKARYESVGHYHHDSVTIRDVLSSVVLFSGPANFERTVPASADDIEALRIAPGSTNDSPLMIEVTDIQFVWPTLQNRRVGKLCCGTDEQSREVQWLFEGHRLF